MVHVSLRWWLCLLTAVLVAGCQMPQRDSGAAPLASTAAVPPAQHSPGPYRVTLLAGGRDVEFLGEISIDSVAALQQVLVTHPEVRVLQLTSPGGRRSAVNDIWLTLVQRNLTTVVPLFCASACAELFLAGKKRVLPEGAVLGFHQSHIRFVGAIEAEAISLVTAASNTAMADRMVERGVDRSFAQRAIATPPNSFWYPSAQELRTAGVVTQLGGGFAVPSTGADLALLLDWSIFNSPVESAYHSAFPEDYAALRTAAWKTIRRESFASEQPAALIAQAIRGSIARALSVASDEAAASFVRGLTAGIAFVTRSSPEDCFAFFDGDLLTDATLDTESEERIGAYYTQLTAALFAAVGREPRQRPPTRAEYEAAFERLAARVRSKGVFDERDAPVMADPERDPARYCGLAVRLMDAVLQEPPPGRGILLRGMLLYAAGQP